MLKESSSVNIITILVWNASNMDINDYGNYLFFLRIDELHKTINPHRIATDSNCTFLVFIKCSVTQSAESNYSWKENLQNL